MGPEQAEGRRCDAAAPSEDHDRWVERLPAAHGTALAAGGSDRTAYCEACGVGRIGTFICVNRWRDRRAGHAGHAPSWLDLNFNGGAS